MNQTPGKQKRKYTKRAKKKKTITDLSDAQLVSYATAIADKYICVCGLKNADRIIQLAAEKTKAKRTYLKEKYPDEDI